MAEQIDLGRALVNLIELDDADLGRVELRHEPLGEVVFPTGRIVACDPLVSPEISPFVTAVNPGRYPLVLSVAHFCNQYDGQNDVRVAYAVLLIASTAQVIRWEMAVRPGQDASTLDHGDIFGYGVDSATGTLADVAAMEALRRRFDENPDYSDAIVNQMYPNRVRPSPGLLLTLDEETGLNAPFFETGWGDGFYASYFGYDASGAATCLVTDFGIVQTGTPGEP